ncbi:MAG: Yip1 family protein [Stenotrophobium sp.]
MINTNRIKSILLTPRSEWPVVADETATTQGLYTGYVIPLAMIRPICAFIGLSLVGITVFGGHYRTPIGAGIVHALLSFVLTLVGVYVLALIIDALAPGFGGQKDPIQALKVSVYSATPPGLPGSCTCCRGCRYSALSPGCIPCTCCIWACRW